jgi:hypothetical protein
MTSTQSIWNPFGWFPNKRFEDTFPLVYWFAGLWFYLKSFLYLCYIYMLGIEPPPYPIEIKIEVVYFALTAIPFFYLGWSFWKENSRTTVPSIALLAIDTPFIFFHVLRLAYEGYLDSGLTKVLEFGSLALNVIALGWLIGYRISLKDASSRK